MDGWGIIHLEVGNRSRRAEGLDGWNAVHTRVYGWKFYAVVRIMRTSKCPPSSFFSKILPSAAQEYKRSLPIGSWDLGKLQMGSSTGEENTTTQFYVQR